MIVYKITNLLNQKIYIGLDTKNRPWYFGSGLYIGRAIKKYGKCNFVKETIDTASSFEELCEKEKYWIEFYNSTDVNIGYNLTDGGVGSFGRVVSEETKEKISKSKQGNKYCLGRRLSEETKQRMSESAKNKAPISEETKQKMSEAHKKENLSAETRQKMSNNMKLRNKIAPIVHSDEAKLKMSIKAKEAAKNRKPISEETRRRMSESAKNKAPISEETKQKMSEAAKKRHTTDNDL